MLGEELLFITNPDFRLIRTKVEVNYHRSTIVGASSLERLAVEDSLTELTQEFKRIPVKGGATSSKAAKRKSK